MPALMNRLLVEFLPAIPEPILWRFSRKYIAGPRLEHAVSTVRALNAEGCMGTIDNLGEFTQEENVCLEYVRMYRSVLEAIRDEKLDCRGPGSTPRQSARRRTRWRRRSRGRWPCGP